MIGQEKGVEVGARTNIGAPVVLDTAEACPYRPTAK